MVAADMHMLGVEALVGAEEVKGQTTEVEAEAEVEVEEVEVLVQF